MLAVSINGNLFTFYYFEIPKFQKSKRWFLGAKKEISTDLNKWFALILKYKCAPVGTIKFSFPLNLHTITVLLQ